MHHRNHKNSTSNFNNPNHHQPQKPNHMTYQYGRNDMPNPQKPKGSSFISKIKGKFQEKPATPEEVRQLGLNAKRETFKTQIQKAKAARPSRFSNFGGGFSNTPSRRTSHRVQQDSGLFGGGGSFLNFGEGPSLSFLTGDTGKKSRKKQDSGFGQGISDLF